MAINLSKFGIGTYREPDESVLSMIGRQREEARRAKRDEEVATLNLARLTEEAADRKRRAQEEADTNRVMGDYIQRKAVAGPLPAGVSGPVLPVEEVDKETALNLSRINPSTALAFQNERQGERDAAAKAAAAEREAERRRALEERRALNDDRRTTAYVQRITGMGKPKVTGTSSGSGADGTVAPDSPVVPGTGKPPTEVQSNMAIYGRRMQEAMQDMDALEVGGFNRASRKQGLLAFTPTSFGFKSPQLQQQEQAERNFVNAALRRESGAAISPSEFASAEKQYFPRAGDSPATIAQKKRNREIAIASFKGLAGKAWEQAGGDVIPPPSESFDPNEWEPVK